MDVSPLTAEVAEQLGVKNVEGVVISRVVPNSPADMAGLQSGWIITQANRKPVKTVDDLVRFICPDLPLTNLPFAAPGLPYRREPLAEALLALPPEPAAH